MTTPDDYDKMRRELQQRRDELAVEIEAFKSARDQEGVNSPDETYLEPDEMTLRFERAERAELVRGEHYTVWWPVVERLEREEKWAEYEELLLEIRDATERGSAIVGYTIAPSPAERLADLYLDQGDKASAVFVLRRFLEGLRQFREVEPTGGDAGEKRVRKFLERLTDDEGK